MEGVEKWNKNEDMTLTGYPSIDKPWMKYYSEKAIRGKLPECSIYEYMYESNKDYPDDIAINYYGRKISYAELFRNIDRTAAALQEIGVQSGEIVTVALPSIPEALYVVYALNRIGAVANMIHLLAGKKEIIAYLNEVNSKVAIIFDKTMDILGGDIEKTSVRKAIVVTAGISLPFGLKLLYAMKTKKPVCVGVYSCWEDFIKKGEASKLKSVRKDCHQMALISHTGGTTGEPKGVMCSDLNVNSLILQLLCNFEFDRQEVSLSVLPPFVNYSLVESMLCMLRWGITVVLIPDYKPEKFVEYVRKYHPNEVLSIPSYWEALLRIEGIEKEDLSCLRHIYYGGEELDKNIREKLNSLLSGCGAKTELCVGLGCTEMVAGATVSFVECNPADSVGIPMVNTNCKIVMPDTEDELSYNQEGEICFSGQTLMLGYYNKPDATEEVIKVHKDGSRWLHTGDLGYINEDGVIFVVGRIKRIIMTKGDDGQVTKLFPDRIEKAIYTDQSVEVCCVVGVPDEHRIHYPKAYIVLKRGEEATDARKKAIIENCRAVLPEYMVPSEVEFRPDLPRTDRGKIDYRALEERK